MGRVVITGLGPLTPIGIGKEEFWDSLSHGRSDFRELPEYDVPGLNAHLGGDVWDFDEQFDFPSDVKRNNDRFSLYALAGAHLALEDAGIHPESLTDDERWRYACILGIGVGGIETFQNVAWDYQERLRAGGPRPSSLVRLVTKLMPNRAASEIMTKLNLHGVSESINTACASSNSSVITAAQKIQANQADVVITGGAEYSNTVLCQHSFDRAKAALSATGSFPFDLNRDGFIMSSGAGILILEDEAHARARGAHIYGELVGYGETSDGYHVTAPHPEGVHAIEAFRQAFRMADVSPYRLDYVNAHGTGTKLNDAMETKVLKAVFGEYALPISDPHLRVSSTKSMTGHMTGAAGGVEIIATLLAMQHGFIPPTINLKTPDPECDLDYTPNVGVSYDIKLAASASYGFGGHNAVLLLQTP